MSLFNEYVRYETRRQFLRKGASFMGTAALAALGGASLRPSMADNKKLIASLMGSHFAPKAKRVIYLHMVGGPSQMDLYDYKPVMGEWYDKDLPESVRDNLPKGSVFVVSLPAMFAVDEPLEPELAEALA